MRIFYLTVCITIFNIVTGFSQSTFERLYPDPENDYISLDVDFINDSYYTLSLVKDKDSINFQTVNVTKLSSKGDYNKQSFNYYIADSLILFPNGSIEATDSTLIITATLDNDTLQSDVIFTIDYNGEWGVLTNEMTGSNEKVDVSKSNQVLFNGANDIIVHSGDVRINDIPSYYLNFLDLNGNFIKSKTYGYQLNTVIRAHDVTPVAHDSSYIVAGILDTFNTEFFINKLDSIGDIEWSKKYIVDNLNLKGYASDIVEMNDSTYIVGFNYGDNAYLMALDSIGNDIWVRKLSADSTIRIGALERSNDAEFTFTMEVDIDENYRQLLLLSFDINGNKKWEKQNKTTSKFPYFNNDLIKSTTNNWIYLTTGYDVDQPDDNTAMYMMVADSDGNTPCNMDSELITANPIETITTDTIEMLPGNDIGYTKIVVNKNEKSGFLKPYTISYSPSEFCPNEPIDVLLEGFVDGGTEYLWASGETTDSLRVMDIGSFPIMVKVLETYCYTVCDTASIKRKDPNQISIEIDPSNYCIDGTVSLTVTKDETLAAAPLSTYIWSTGETENSITVAEFGLYTVTVTDECGDEYETSYNYNESDIPAKTTISISESFNNYCTTGKITLTLNSEVGFGSITWSTGETDVTTIEVEPGAYSVEITDVCQYLHSISVQTNADNIECPGPFQWPNAFTPNENDEEFINDRVFKPYYNPDIELGVTSYNLVIVNRWGQVIFETDNYDEGWNGLYNDKKSVGGTYFFKAVYETDIQSYEEKGGLVLIR